jgi:hypothetical protein
VDFGLPCLDYALLAIHHGSGAQIVIFLAVKPVLLPSHYFPLRIEFDSLRWTKSLTWSLLVVLHIPCSSPIGAPAFASEVA